MQCPLCREDSASWPEPDSRSLDVACTNCGNFRISTSAFEDLRGSDQAAFYLGSWVCQENQTGITPFVDSKLVASIETYPRPGVKRRAELYLARSIQLLNGRLTGRIDINNPALRVASWSFYREDLRALAYYLIELGAIWRDPNSENYQLVAKAHVLNEQWANTRGATSQVFVAIWFDEQLKEPYKMGFAIAINNAGYDPVRIDRKEHDGKIDDQIIAEIRRSAFVVADFTGHRGGVYYEAGFAHGLGRRVIFTCKREDIKNLHFDVRQYNTLLWDSPADIVAPLQNRILALFGAGLLKPDAKPLPI
jgi:hypothetical protein